MKPEMPCIQYRFLASLTPLELLVTMDLNTHIEGMGWADWLLYLQARHLSPCPHLSSCEFAWELTCIMQIICLAPRKHLF